MYSHSQAHQLRHYTCAITHNRTLLRRLRLTWLDQQDHKVQRVTPDHKVPQVRKEYKDLQVQQDGLVRKAFRDRLVRQVTQDLKAQPVRPDGLDQLGQLATRDRQDLQRTQPLAWQYLPARRGVRH